MNVFSQEHFNTSLSLFPLSLTNFLILCCVDKKRQGMMKILVFEKTQVKYLFIILNFRHNRKNAFNLRSAFSLSALSAINNILPAACYNSATVSR